MPEVVHTFYSSFWRLFIAMLVIGQGVFWAFMSALLLVDVIAYRATFFLAGSVAVLATTSLICTVLLAPAAVWMKYALPVRLSATGFSCPNTFGKMKTVPWSAIREVKPFTVPGIPYLLVKADQTRWRLWIPLFLIRLPECVELMEQFAGPDNRLYQALWPRVEQK